MDGMEYFGDWRIPRFALFRFGTGQVPIMGQSCGSGPV